MCGETERMFFVPQSSDLFLRCSLLLVVASSSFPTNTWNSTTTSTQLYGTIHESLKGAMPLHLLSKKSWNVWNADNISRVDRDITRGETIEAEQDQALREYHSLRQLAILRGEAPPPPPRVLSTEEIEQRVRDEAKGERLADADGRGASRKRRKLKGEDETDMELRLATEAVKERYGESEKTVRRSRETSKKIDAPIVDPNGHINLFPIDPHHIAKQKNAEAEAEKAKKIVEFEDQYTMRFSNAAGRDGLKEGPWYVNKDEKKKTQKEQTGEDANLTYMEYKNLWGKPDSKRKDREQQRVNTSDPMAVMQRAQSQLKRSEKDKQTWADRRSKELAQLKEDNEREDRDFQHKRPHRRSDEHDDDLERRERRHRKSRNSNLKGREHRHSIGDFKSYKEDNRGQYNCKTSRPRNQHRDTGTTHRPSRIPDIDNLEPLSLDAPPPETSKHQYFT
jgi:hypothetical protein